MYYPNTVFPTNAASNVQTHVSKQTIPLMITRPTGTTFIGRTRSTDLITGNNGLTITSGHLHYSPLQLMS